MSAPVDVDLTPVRLAAAMAAARMIGRYSDRPLSTLSSAELEVLNTAVGQLACPLLAEISRRKEAAQARRGRGGLRLAAAGGELTEAGKRSARARRAARARWSR